MSSLALTQAETKQPANSAFSSKVDAEALFKSTHESSYGLYQGVGHNFGKINVFSNNNRTANPIRVQSKLKVNQLGDVYEREADAMADGVMQISDTQARPTISAPVLIQRKGDKSDEERTQPPFLHPFSIQRKLAEASNSSVEGLDKDTRPALENFLSADLSHVKVHNNPASHVASNLINARAYTTGNHIYLGGEANGMSPIQRKSLLAHEVVHTMQQKSFSPATIQGKSTIGASNSKHEQEANSIAHAFTQSQTESYRSTALQMRSNMRISPVTNATIQRLPKTWGGEWFADTYTEYSSGTGRGIDDMQLRFKPGPVVDAELIGLTQAYRSIHNKTPFYLNNDAFYKGRAIKSADAITTDPVTKETDEGNQIDRLKEKNNPIYGTNSLNKGEGLDKSISAGNSQQGWHYKDSTGKIIEKDATLSDAPKIRSVDVSKSSGQIFETTALAIKGNQTGTYYGSVRWGWRSDDKGNFAKLPLEVVSQGVPSSTFMKSAEVWNSSQSSTGAETVDLPLVDVKVTTTAISEATPPSSPALSSVKRTISAGTRVQIIFGGASTPTGEKLPQIRVVDGLLTGTTMSISLEDFLMSLRNERP